MAGISEEDIQRVREANDIVSVFADRVQMRQKGRTFWCCCPFHDETTPSCQVDPATQLFYCFGCHEGGDVFSYIMKTEDIDFPDAVRMLARRAGLEIHETGKDAVSHSYKTRLREVCAETREFYHYQLMRVKTPEADSARAYLSSRGLGGDVAKRWMLGFAPGRDALIGHLKKKGYTHKEMIDANVVVSYEGRRPKDRFFNRIMFPISDEQGECIAFGGRVIGTGEPKYLNSQETPLFHKSNVLYGLDRAKSSMTSTGAAIVVEGYTDVIALHEAGVKNAVATLGTALTKQHIRVLSRHAGKRIVYLFDGDEAGQRAADRALGFIGDSMTPEAGRRRIELAACTLPDNLDPADFVAQRGVDELQSQLDRAKPLISYGIDRRLGGHDTSTAEGRSAAFADAIGILAPIKDSLLAKDYAVQIASRLHMRENDALAALVRLERPQQDAQDSPERKTGSVPASPAATISKAERNRRRFEAVFIGLCARYPHLALVHADALGQVSWHVPLHAEISDLLLAIIARNPQAKADEIVGAITQEHPQAARVFVDGGAGNGDPEAYARYLAEELALGDMEEAIETYRAKLKDPGAMEQEEYDLLFRTVASLQKDIAARRLAHKRSII